MTTETKKIPTIIVTSDRWSRDPFVVFEGDELIGYAITTDRVNVALFKAQESDEEITREQIEASMVDDFNSENDSVDEFWPEHMICRADDDYYKYDADGRAKWIGNLDSIEEAIAE